MNIVVRPICDQDLEYYIAFSKQANFGFTTLPRDPNLIKTHLQWSVESFKKEVTTPGDEFYLFVAEDLDTKQVLGISGILATTGGKDPLHYFRKESYTVDDATDATVKEIPILTTVSYVRGSTEICSLYVLPEFRSYGIGKLLSLARFLYIKAYPHRFTSTIFAELRGVVSKHITSIFWESVGRHFFNKPIEEVYEMLQYSRSFIANFLPKYPIYCALLPQEVQDTIGKNDPQTSGAYATLIHLGFEKTADVDLFDAGPKLSCDKESITLIQESERVHITNIVDSLQTQIPAILAAVQPNFRACTSCFAYNESGGITILKSCAAMLGVNTSDTLLLYKTKRKPQ